MSHESAENGANNAPTHQQDAKDIALAHRYRISLTSLPTQSSFRVVALVFYTDNSGSNQEDLPPPTVQIQHDARSYVVGTNDEPGGFIGGAICAERAALVQLRFLPLAEVMKIVIVTDHEDPISPGMLCREFMAGHSAVPWAVPIVLAGSASKQVISTTLYRLFPHPSPYARLTASQSNNAGKQFWLESTLENQGTRFTNEIVKLLMDAALKAAQEDKFTQLHPIRYGAAVLFDNDSVVSASQKKALEYGASLDAVSQLASDIERQRNNRPMLLVQVDSYGIAHAPFARARAFLSEHGYGDCRVLVHNHSQEDDGTTIGNLVDVTVSDLAPQAPDMGNLWCE